MAEEMKLKGQHASPTRNNICWQQVKRQGQEVLTQRSCLTVLWCTRNVWGQSW